MLKLKFASCASCICQLFSFLALVPSTGWTQSLSTANAEFEQGEFQMAARYMSQLLNLETYGDSGQNLRFSRTWSDPFEDKTDDEIRATVLKSLASRDGFSEEESGSRADMIMRLDRNDRGRRRRGPVTSFERAARAVAMFVTSDGGSAGVIGKNSLRLVRNGMSFNGLVNDDTLSIYFQELLPPYRILNVSDDHDGRLSIELLGDSYVVRSDQLPNGAFSILYLGPEHSELKYADNFSEFASRYSGDVESWLLPFYKHIGIGIPESLADAASRSNDVKDRTNTASDKPKWEASGELFREGPLQQVKDSLNSLVELREMEEKLVFNREFRKFGGVPDAAGIRAQIRKQIEEHAPDGFPIDEQMAKLKDSDLPSAYQTPVKKAFESFTMEGSRGRGAGSSGGGNSLQLRFEYDTLKGIGTVIGDRIVMRFAELDTPNRTLVISDSNEGGFYLCLANHSSFCEIRQTESGEFRVARRENDQLIVESGITFTQFVADNPKLVNDWLNPLLIHYGISPPGETNGNDSRYDQ